MLVLTRKIGESILIGEGIEVRVVGVNGKKVRLGMTAPSDVPILRDEIIQKRESPAADSKKVEHALL